MGSQLFNNNEAVLLIKTTAELNALSALLRTSEDPALRDIAEAVGATRPLIPSPQWPELAMREATFWPSRAHADLDGRWSAPMVQVGGVDVSARAHGTTQAGGRHVVVSIGTDDMAHGQPLTVRINGIEVFDSEKEQYDK